MNVRYQLAQIAPTHLTIPGGAVERIPVEGGILCHETGPWGESWFAIRSGVRSVGYWQSAEQAAEWLTGRGR